MYPDTRPANFIFNVISVLQKFIVVVLKSSPLRQVGGREWN